MKYSPPVHDPHWQGGLLSDLELLDWSECTRNSGVPATPAMLHVWVFSFGQPFPVTQLALVQSKPQILRQPCFCNDSAGYQGTLCLNLKLGFHGVIMISFNIYPCGKFQARVHGLVVTESAFSPYTLPVQMACAHHVPVHFHKRGGSWTGTS
jgi:hypothetical protein